MIPIIPLRANQIVGTLMATNVLAELKAHREHKREQKGPTRRDEQPGEREYHRTPKQMRPTPTRETRMRVAILLDLTVIALTVTNIPWTLHFKKNIRLFILLSYILTQLTRTQILLAFHNALVCLFIQQPRHIVLQTVHLTNQLKRLLWYFI